MSIILPTSALAGAASMSIIQLLLIIVTICLRYNKFKSIGLYNRKVTWPLSYKIKIGLQVTNIILVLM